MRDNSVDVVYTISVFTHMSEAFQLEWMAELGRVLVPGGLLIFTTHGEEKRYKLFGSELSAFDEGRLVVKANYIEGKKHTLAYHPNEYVETRMLGGFDLLEHVDSDGEHGVGQNIWIARMC